MKEISLSRKFTGPLRGLSLQHRIPLLISLLLFVVMAFFILISYFSIRKIEVSSGRERLETLAAKISDVLSESLLDFTESTKEASLHPAVKQFLLHPVEPPAPATLSLLKKYDGRGVHEKTILLDAQASPLVMAVDSAGTLLAKKPLYIPVIKDKNHQACNIYKINDTIYYAVISPVYEDNRHLGYLVRSRHVRTSNNFFSQYSTIAGRGVTLLVGNEDGTLWTNLIGPVQYHLPESFEQLNRLFQYKSAVGDLIVGISRKIKNTPWVLVVEAPYSLALRASTIYLQWMIGVAAVLITCGVIIAWYLGRNLTIPLKELIVSSRALGSGDSGKPVPVHRTDEVGTLAHTFNTMMEQVKAARKDTLIQIESSAALNKELRRLTAHLNTVREEERVSIARELHDQLGQVLTGFKMDLHFLKKQLKKEGHISIDEKVKPLEAAVDEGVGFVRKLSSELRAGPLEDLGLVAAIQWYGNSFTQRYGITVEVESTPAEIELPLPLSTAVFRIFQEALTNVARHSQASRVQVAMEQQQQKFRISITDNGKGFDNRPGKTRKTLGLLGMKERALMIASELKIISQPGHGCKIELELDIPKTGLQTGSNTSV